MGAQLIFIRQLLIKECAVFLKILFVVFQCILIEKIVQRRILSVYVKIAKRRNSFDVVQDVKKAVFYFGKQFGRISLVGPAAAKRIQGITLVKKCFYPFGRKAKNIMRDLAGGILLSVKPNISVAEINGKMAQMCFSHRFCFNQIHAAHLVSVISIP